MKKPEKAPPHNYILKGMSNTNRRKKIRSQALKLTDSAYITPSNIEFNRDMIERNLLDEQKQEKSIANESFRDSLKREKRVSPYKRDMHLSCGGYSPGVFKEFVDSIRRPDWFKPDEKQCVWVMYINDLSDGYHLSDCLNAGKVFLLPSDVTAYERYQRYFLKGMLPKDLILIIGTENRSIRAMGAVKDDEVGEEQDIDRGTIFSRNIEWYVSDKNDVNFSLELFTEEELQPRNNDFRIKRFTQNPFFYPKLDLTPSELIDILLYKSYLDNSKACEDGQNEKQYVAIIHEVDPENYDKVWGDFKEHIKPDGMEPSYFRLRDSNNPFNLPENLHIYGYMQPITPENKGVDENEIKKQFKIFKNRTGL